MDARTRRPSRRRVEERLEGNLYSKALVSCPPSAHSPSVCTPIVLHYMNGKTTPNKAVKTSLTGQRGKCGAARLKLGPHGRRVNSTILGEFGPNWAHGVRWPRSLDVSHAQFGTRLQAVQGYHPYGRLRTSASPISVCTYTCRLDEG